MKNKHLNSFETKRLFRFNSHLGKGCLHSTDPTTTSNTIQTMTGTIVPPFIIDTRKRNQKALKNIHPIKGFSKR